MRPTTILGEALSPSINSASVPELSVAIAMASASIRYPVDLGIHPPPLMRPAMALLGRIAYVMAMTQPHRPVGPGDLVFLVDGSSFIFRAYYQSIRQDQKYNYRMDRLPTGAVRLFATKVLQFIRDGAGGFKPTHLAMIFDKTENSFRRDIYPQYKA